MASAGLHRDPRHRHRPSGVSAAWIGTTFLEFQRAAWLLPGGVYMAIGAFYILGKAGVLTRTIGPPLARLPAAQGSVTLGILFGLNIPACAAPLLFALFGLALSLPLAVAVGFAPARRAPDWLAGLSRRIPFWRWSSSGSAYGRSGSALL